jgi:AcrR family transcriptional regulator
MMTPDLTRRQTELADAALRIIARDGMAALSFRTVAADSGWSLGAVQKAFPTKDRMLAAAFTRLRARDTPMPAGEPGRPALRGWLVELLLSILPLDHRRVETQRQGDAFAQYALADPQIAAAIAASDDEVRGLLASLVRRAIAEGELDTDADPDAVAWALLALAQGLAAQLLYQPQAEDVVHTRLDAVVRLLLGG